VPSLPSQTWFFQASRRIHLWFLICDFAWRQMSRDSTGNPFRLFYFCFLYEILIINRVYFPHAWGGLVAETNSRPDYCPRTLAPTISDHQRFPGLNMVRLHPESPSNASRGRVIHLTKPYKVSTVRLDPRRISGSVLSVECVDLNAVQHERRS
jgi:hypothetical protein